MPIVLTAEDGTGVAGANTFASLVQARDYAVARGVTLPADDEALKVFLVKACDYLKSLSFQGTKTHADTSASRYLPWPRSGLTLDDADWPQDAVPPDIIDAQCQLCIEQFNGVDLMPTASSAAIKSEKIGPLETVYAGSNRATRPSMPLVDALLEGWVSKGRGFGLRTTRI